MVVYYVEDASRTMMPITQINQDGYQNGCQKNQYGCLMKQDGRQMNPTTRQYTDLVEGYNEGRVALFEQVNRLNSLWLESVHNVNHQDSNVTQRGAATP